MKKRIAILSMITFSICMVCCLTACGNLSGDPAVPSGNQVEITENDTSESGMPSSVPDTSTVEQSSPPVFDFETKTVRLNSGYEMPVAGLGTYALSDEECYNSVTALLENGGNVRNGDLEGIELNGTKIRPCFSESGGMGLPGDFSSPSCFVRLAFLKEFGVKGKDENEGAACTFRLFQNIAFLLIQGIWCLHMRDGWQFIWKFI